MKTLFTAALFAFSLSPAFAQLDPQLLSAADPVCVDTAVAANSFEALTGNAQAFCAGTCERDFDCMPGCSCHMSGRCM